MTQPVITEYPIAGALPTWLCKCGCMAGAHVVRWRGDTFLGTRCEAHGGHKFTPDRDLLGEPPEPEIDVESDDA